MANLQRLLTRRPHIDEAEVEDVRERTMARLAALSDGGATTDTTEATDPTAVSESTAAPIADTTSASGPSDPTARPSSSTTAAQTAPPAPPKPAGPKIIVPRTISLGSPETPQAGPETPSVEPERPAVVPEGHRTPSIIVLGAPESASAAEAEAVSETKADTLTAVVDDVQADSTETPPVEVVVAEAVVAESPVEPVAVEADVAEAVVAEAILDDPEVTIATIEPTEATDQQIVVGSPVIAKPAVKRASKPKATKTKLERAKATPAKPARAKAPVTVSPSKPTATKRPAVAKPARRAATAVPVIAEPEPVIDLALDGSSPWPGQWLKDESLTAAAPEPAVVRRDPAMPVDRVDVVRDEWDPEVAAVAEPVAVAAGVAEAGAAAEVVQAPVTAAPTELAPVEMVPVDADPLERPDPILSAASSTAPVAADSVTAKAAVSTPTRTGPARSGSTSTGRRPAPKPPRNVTVARPPVQATPALAAFCPYCALALEPPPTASRRCTRCKQRIVVKRVQGRVVYLTEAAVEVFESERIRSTNFGRWSRERAQWLKLAKSVHADPGRIDRLGTAPLSDKVVASAKTLYTSTTERQYRDAKRDDQWEDASRLKREQAAAMHRIEGSPASPTEEVLAMYREAVSTELRGIGKMAKEAALVGSDCCEACRADDGRTFKIAAELRTPRLPHDGCPKGLCRCHWDLTLRDRDMVQRYLRRTVRAPKAKRPSA